MWMIESRHLLLFQALRRMLRCALNPIHILPPSLQWITLLCYRTFIMGYILRIVSIITYFSQEKLDPRAKSATFKFVIMTHGTKVPFQRKLCEFTRKLLSSFRNQLQTVLDDFRIRANCYETRTKLRPVYEDGKTNLSSAGHLNFDKA